MRSQIIQDVTAFGQVTSLVQTRDFDKLVAEVAKSSYITSIAFCNVHMLMLSQKDVTLANAMNDADVVFADGVPIAWLQRRLTGKPAKVIRGYEMMLAVCDHAARAGESVGLLGSTEDVIDGLVRNLTNKFSNLQISYKYCPPYQQGELILSQETLTKLKAANLKWLFVGLGCPKQEKWIARYKDELGCRVLGVGAAFDWLSGREAMPPEWMWRFALGWLYRLARNPVKMWRRYLIYNTKFLIRLPAELRRRR